MCFFADPCLLLRVGGGAVDPLRERLLEFGDRHRGLHDEVPLSLRVVLRSAACLGLGSLSCLWTNVCRVLMWGFADARRLGSIPSAPRSVCKTASSARR